MKMKIWYACFYLLPFALCCICMEEKHMTSLKIAADDPDMFRNVSELITSKGYSLEEHTIQTSDGYLLSVQRITHGRNCKVDGPEKEVVLLVHGVMTDAAIWVLNYPDRSLGFVLSDAGYDVWLLNTRGCNYSRKHIIYTTNQFEFWNFSFDEVAQYDVPATIDYILDITGKEDLFIIGHSQGTTVIFAMLSEMPDYNDKVKLFIALAPETFMGSMTSVITKMIPFADVIMLGLKLMNHGEFLPNRNVVKTLLFAFSELEEAQLKETRLGVLFAHYPSSTSAKSLHHFAQLVKSKKFRKYDYKRRRNLKVYHQEEPPDYDVSGITAPVALFWSAKDELAHPEDVAILQRNLNSLVYDSVPLTYNHADYFIAQSVPQLINEPIVNLLANYCNTTNFIDVFNKYI